MPIWYLVAGVVMGYCLGQAHSAYRLKDMYRATKWRMGAQIITIVSVVVTMLLK